MLAQQKFTRMAPGIDCGKGWSIKRYRTAAKADYELWLDNIYDYNSIFEKVKERQERKMDDMFFGAVREEVPVDLDPYLWDEFTKILENYRQLIEETCREYGVNDLESLLLSFKFAWSTLKKFRNMMWREFNAGEDRTDYNSLPLKEAIGYLIIRFEMIMASDKYLFSKEAADGQLGAFRKSAAYEAARMLEEETGAILHAKITL
jgi:hypothetical protein